MKVNIGPFPDDGSPRVAEVTIDDYDTWNIDSTLALVIYPLLKQFKNNVRHGAYFTDDADVPHELRSTNAKPKAHEHELDEFYFKRWEWILDEMTWAFEQLQPDCDWEKLYTSGVIDYISEPVPGTGYINPTTGEEEDTNYRFVEGPNHTYQADYDGIRRHEERIDRGVQLFGKYFRKLWD